MTATFVLVTLIIVVALIFDFTIGFDAGASSLATVRSIRVLSPGKPVLLAGFFNFVGAFWFETKVARTIGKGLINTDVINEWMSLANGACHFCLEPEGCDKS